MLVFIRNFNYAIFLLFTLCYLYQIVYALVVLFHKKEKPVSAKKLHRFGVVIAARNESSVIGQLIQSIHAQDYPSELIDIFVVADNCTDNTAGIAQQAGAHVFVRNNNQLVGKGYALDYAFKEIFRQFGSDYFEGFLVFDADNLLRSNYISEMNRVFDQGYRVITSYRNSKNYDTNWLTAGYSLWFLRESKYLNNARMLLNTSCAISGTGFLIHNDIVKKNNGWKHHLLTEDIEFSIDSVIEGETIGYAANAMLYDEQPYLFEQSWNQRLRWSKGFYQVFRRYGAKLIRSIFSKRSFACYDMLMTIAPAMFVSLLTVCINFIFFITALLNPSMSTAIIQETGRSIFASFFNFYIVLYIFGLLTTITEWKQINTTTAKKILYTFSFPIFIFTYIPISIVALFKKIGWKPITHTVTKSIEDIHPEAVTKS